MKKTIRDYAGLYSEQFGENFPFMLTMGVGDAGIIEIIQKCLKDNKPYEPEGLHDPNINF